MRRWRSLAGHANALTFGCGLAVLCTSVAQWSGPMAGTILGAVLMVVAAWPYLMVRKG